MTCTTSREWGHECVVYNCTVSVLALVWGRALNDMRCHADLLGMSTCLEHAAAHSPAAEALPPPRPGWRGTRLPRPAQRMPRQIWRGIQLTAEIPCSLHCHAIMHC